MNTHGTIRDLDRATERGQLAALLFDLNELEEETYRLALDQARYLEHGGSARRRSRMGHAAPIRALVAHANASLDEIHVHARRRRIRLGSAKALLVDAIRRIAAATRETNRDVEDELSVALGRGTALGRRIQAAALEAGDGEVARWARGWVRTRSTLVEDAYFEGALLPRDFRLHDRFGMAAE